MKILNKKVFLILFLCILTPIISEPLSKDFIEKKLEELKQLNPAQRKEKTELLDYETTASILSYIRYKYIKNDPEMEIIFSLYDHLANLNAIKLSQKRLNRLLFVIIFTLILFSSYLTYILINQNKIIKELKEYSHNQEENQSFEVFKG
ncbi:MAG: hypothetical protein KatS3mg129_1195 [Leptospiraceae bacterium]|nr:MAG: hypothetical protein KatS3mg129_1195 [Leptospiraceae bacterium]